jgi:redox-sensitive bicupin YhaK (pirin superfamily)
MFGVQFAAAWRDSVRPAGASAPVARSQARPVALLASGRRHGAITRLITPWSIGELTAPFVFLDYAEIALQSQPRFGIQPYASIGALTIVLNGAVSFDDATGTHGEVSAGGFAWMRAAHGAWYGEPSATGEPLRMFKLWISLPEPNSAAESARVAPHEVEQAGPVRVILGRFGRACSRIGNAPADLNCFHVRLKDGQRWRYVAPDGHNVTWLAVDRGGLHLQDGGRVYWEQIAVFGDSGGVIDALADGETSFVLGSARRQSQPFAPHTSGPVVAVPL